LKDLALEREEEVGKKRMKRKRRGIKERRRGIK
jgi:hypothetical protein